MAGYVVSEYESRGRGHTPSYAQVPRRTPPDHQPSDQISQFVREVAAVGAAVEGVRQAHAANNPVRWHEAKHALERELATATKALESVRAAATATPLAGQEELASAEAAFADHQASVRTLAEAPRGWKAASREAELLAIVSAPNEGGAKDGWERKTTALKRELDQLSAAECQTLAQRIRKQSPGDPIASALAPGVRMNQSRYDDLLGYLDGARKRAALRASIEATHTESREATNTSAHEPPIETAETSPQLEPRVPSVAVSEPEALDATLRAVL
ncbi:MAG: hypothetical protein H0T46_20230 [Deltaproteobacteria bacterium]|nr:hypothetical protein [Deltaproteobacteria bacterium]